MAGIAACGVYLPRLRLARQAVFSANSWFAPGLRGAARGERTMANWDEDALTSSRIYALTGATLGDSELAEAGEVHVASALEDVGDGIQDRVDRLPGLLLVSDPRVAREHVEKFSLCHVYLLLKVGVRAEPNSGS